MNPVETPALASAGVTRIAWAGDGAGEGGTDIALHPVVKDNEKARDGARINLYLKSKDQTPSADQQRALRR